MSYSAPYIVSLGFAILVSSCIYMKGIRISTKELKPKNNVRVVFAHRTIIIHILKTVKEEKAAKPQTHCLV